MNQDIQSYNQAQTGENQVICELLAKEINLNLPEAESKKWHGSPVWFLDGNPVAGYSVLKDCVRLLFWSGQSFSEPKLQNEGSFKAAEIRYTSAGQIDADDLKRWIEKSKNIQWDYKNIVKKRGVLDRLK
ncbi:DUF1801 domain-containing protein [Patescibacteria group bacterium]|nr:MAG: DUF1801 domain-containing protein [Patescibacteria group bacterium]